MSWLNDTTLRAELLVFFVRLAGKAAFALIVWLIGRYAIRLLLKLADRSPSAAGLDPMVHRFVRSFLKTALYLVLLISIVGILGVPMASVVAVLASAGVAIGLAVQGSLSSLAGGVMLLIFRPFHAGDYVDAAGASGTVQEVNLFYTVLLSVDNKRITIPNGSLMNANVENHTAEPIRRIDLTFSCARGEDPRRIQALMQKEAEGHEKVLLTPAPPFARLTGESKEELLFTLRVWCNTGDYWNLYYDLLQGITECFAENGVKSPTARIRMEKEA